MLEGFEWKVARHAAPDVRPKRFGTADVIEARLLEELAAQGVELARKVLDWRQISKLKSTYVDGLLAQIDPRDGRVHTNFQMAVASTGRLSSTDPNLQNIPIRTEEGARLRRVFVAEPGHLLLAADYSQIELRLLAHVADVPSLRDAFARGEDIHSRTAADIFRLDPGKVDRESRRRAKMINFGIIYGISAFGLATRLAIPPNEARTIIDAYFAQYPGIRDYMDRTKAQVRQDGFVSTVFGRRIHIPAIHSKSGAERQFGERAAINAPIQGAAADIIRRAMIRMPAAIAHLPARMLLQVHDELVFEVREDAVDDLIAVARGVMENAADPAVKLSVPLVVDAGTGMNWAEAH